jgi:hypothetical protein
MIGTDPQLARADIILAANRPAPEPTEGELRAVLEHLGVAPSPQHPADREEATE